jgi:hypothetical protein
MRTRCPVPVCVPLTTETPGARELSRSATLATGAVSVTLAASMVDTAFPSSTRRISPVAVVTTGVRLIVAVRIAKSAVTGAPAVTTTARDCS